MAKPLIMIVEDDASVRNLISITLKTHGYRYITAENAEMAIRLGQSHNPDIILLDLGLPDADGKDVIIAVRARANTPIIVISARCEADDKIEALDLGADDYLTKPFSVDELMARLRVTERRLPAINSSTSSPIFKNGELTLDYSAGCAFINDEELHLTPIEYKLLALLSQNIGKVLTHTFLTSKIWGTSLDGDIASLRVFMTSLRKKLEVGTGRQFIQTHIGIGYRMLKIDN